MVMWLLQVTGATLNDLIFVSWLVGLSGGGVFGFVTGTWLEKQVRDVRGAYFDD